MTIKESKIKGIFFIEDEGKRRPATVNISPGFRVYGEKLLKQDSVEYREWDPFRSKIGAALMKGMDIPIKRGDNVLYLGAASGTTASHVSDIVGKEGIVFCVDIADRTMRDLIFVCEHKQNMVPILGDATQPDGYEDIVGERVDFVFEDVAMPNQAEILIMNCEKFLKKGSMAMIAVKSRSIDVSEDPKKIFSEVEEKLKKHFEIVDRKTLGPFEKDHVAFLVKMN